MSRPFAMWLERAFVLPGARRRLMVSGSVLGRAPELGDALVMGAPLMAPLRVHCSSIVGEPRGVEGGKFTMSLAETLPHEPLQLRGAFLTEEGTRVRTFCGLLRGAVGPLRGAARLILRHDRAWGLVSSHLGSLNVVVVGGGLGDGELWDELVRIELDNGETIEMTSIEPIAGEGVNLWRLAQTSSYPRGATERILVTASAGPVRADEVAVMIDGNWTRSTVMQQREGWIQFALDRDLAPPDAESLVVMTPLAA